MKKSYIFRLAQVSVINDHNLPVADKLEVLRELFDKEDLALFVEEQKAEELLKAGGDE